MEYDASHLDSPDACMHHTAYRCADAEQTRAFYEDFLGLPLVDAFEINQTITNDTTEVSQPPTRRRNQLAKLAVC